MVTIKPNETEKSMISRTNTVILPCNNLILQQYQDAKLRIGKNSCPRCQDLGEEYDDDTTVLFSVFKKFDVFVPNRTVDYGEPELWIERARLDQVYLCTVDVYCKKCSDISKIYSNDRFIDQMQEIIDHLKIKEINIPMPRPRDFHYGHRELITYFILGHTDSGKFNEVFDDDEDDEEYEDESEDRPLEYTLEDIHVSTSGGMMDQDFLNLRKLSTYTRRK